MEKLLVRVQFVQTTLLPDKIVNMEEVTAELFRNIELDIATWALVSLIINPDCSFILLILTKLELLTVSLAALDTEIKDCKDDEIMEKYQFSIFVMVSIFSLFEL